MKELKPPHKPSFDGIKTIFLAGTIDMGKSVNWQKMVADEMEESDVTLLNPRRNDWDSSWKQEIGNDQFRGQVEWELNCQEKADLIIMYIDPESKSPITLLELGLFARTKRLIVCCPKGFYRKGNVDIVCAKYGIPMYNTLEELIEEAKKRLSL